MEAFFSRVLSCILRKPDADDKEILKCSAPALAQVQIYKHPIFETTPGLSMTDLL